MLKRISAYAGLIIGFGLGFYLLREHGEFIMQAVNVSLDGVAPLGLYLLGGALTGIILFFLTPQLVNFTGKAVSYLDMKLKGVPTQDIALVVFALLITLVIGILLSILLRDIPGGVYISIVISALLVYLGVKFVMNRKEEFSFLTSLFKKPSFGGKKGEPESLSPKVMDTSVIIDGRIIDICKAGFLEGTLIVPEFVLEELRHIADSPDLLKRNRGRRGLDILNKIQKELDVLVKIYEGDFEDIAEVDSKLVKLAKITEGKILTNDYNLNKVCELQGVPVLNINELANAVKPVVLPGEEMTAQIIKDGKEAGQGIAYLDDGTMIVVEHGKKHIGDTIEVTVTSVLQTAAGRMIFAKPKSASEKVSEVQ